MLNAEFSTRKRSRLETRLETLGAWNPYCRVIILATVSVWYERELMIKLCINSSLTSMSIYESYIYSIYSCVPKLERDLGRTKTYEAGDSAPHAAAAAAAAAQGRHTGASRPRTEEGGIDECPSIQDSSRVGVSCSACLGNTLRQEAYCSAAIIRSRPPPRSTRPSTRPLPRNTVDSVTHTAVMNAQRRTPWRTSPRDTPDPL